MNIYNYIDQIEEWQVGNDFDNISDYALIKTTEYLINNLRTDHEIPSSVWDQFLGIMIWNARNEFITEKQRYWLMANLNLYLGQRDFALEFN